MTHRCFTAADKKLAAKNTRLAFASVLMPLASGRRAKLSPQPIIATEKVDDAKRGRPVTVMANYCPFCGAELK